LFYLAAYVVMNLGAFAVVAILRNRTGSEDLRDFRGLVYRSPLLVVLLGLFVLSLLGLPPLVGFAAKFQVFSVLFDAGKQHSATGNPTLGRMYYALLIIGGINTVISTVYYLKILKVMVLERPLEEVEGRPAVPLRLSIGSAIFGMVLGFLIFAGGVAWNPISIASERGVQDFHAIYKSTANPGMPMGAGGGGGPRPGGGGPPGGGGGARPGGGGPRGGGAGGGRPAGGGPRQQLRQATPEARS
jgi:NADH-quinone oxidoreductase subunit N